MKTIRICIELYFIFSHRMTRTARIHQAIYQKKPSRNQATEKSKEGVLGPPTAAAKNPTKRKELKLQIPKTNTETEIVPETPESDGPMSPIIPLSSAVVHTESSHGVTQTETKPVIPQTEKEVARDPINHGNDIPSISAENSVAITPEGQSIEPAKLGESRSQIHEPQTQTSGKVAGAVTTEPRRRSSVECRNIFDALSSPEREEHKEKQVRHCETIFKIL